jgi:hypothetical protein
VLVARSEYSPKAFASPAHSGGNLPASSCICARVVTAVSDAQKAWAQPPRVAAMTPKKMAEPVWSIRTRRKKSLGSIAVFFHVS